MKKSVKKILCIILCAALLLPAAALSASASDKRPQRYCEPYGIRMMQRFPGDDVYFPEGVTTLNSFASYNGGDAYHFYDQLETHQKLIYNGLKRSRMGLDSEDYVFETDGVKITTKLVEIPFAGSRLASTSIDTLYELLNKHVVAAISALMEDSPEFFWVAGYGFGMLPGYENGKYYIDTLVILLMANPLTYENWEDIESDYNYLNEQINAFEIEGSNRYEKLKSIHDGLCARAEYDFTFELPHAYDPLGVFVDPYDYVCEGYSESFKLLCDREGIPCICVVGEGGYGDNHGPHKWNYVQMEDGQWYGMDLTWDDQEEIMHDYFLVGSDTRSEYFGHHKYIEEHVASGALFMGIPYSLKYPTLSKTRYYYPDNKLTSSDGLWHYVILEDGTASITSGDCDLAAYLGNEENVVVPTEIDGYTVSGLGSSAFAHCEGIKSITVPDSLKSIGRFAFEDCSAEEINLPDSIVEIPYGAFLNASNLSIISIPQGVEKIGAQAFEGCSSLESVEIPDSVNTVAEFAFNGCGALNGITLPVGVDSLPESVFMGCSSLKEIDLSSVGTIGPKAFDGCSSLEKVRLSEALTEIDKRTFAECSQLSEINIPDSLTKIGDAAFYKCYKLEKLIIPASVTEIAKSAFIKAGIKEIYGYTDSYAQQFAEANSIHFVPLDGTDCESGSHLYRSHRSADGTVYECLLCGDSYEAEVPVLTADEALSFDADIDYKDESKIYYALFRAEADGLYKFTVDGDKADEISVSVGDEKLTEAKDEAFELESGKTYTIGITLTDESVEGFELTAEYLGENITVSFPDVHENDWFYEAAVYNAKKGFITGYSNGKFGPADNLKRQDFVVILARIAGADLEPYKNVTSKMPDVVKGSYYAATVNWAVDNEIINGYNNGKFGVGDNITREQVATILYRYMGSPNVTGADATLKPFADANRISAFAKDAVVWAIQNGVISGKKPDTLAPTATASRAEIATIVMRMDQKGMFTV